MISPKAQEIKDSIEIITESRHLISNKIAVYDEQIAVLKDNRKVGGNQSGLSTAELTKMLDLISARMENILNQKNKEEAQLKKADDRIAKLKKQLDEEQKKDYQPGGQLLVKFYAKEATTSAITINYIVPHAGWTPTYDIWADDASSPIKLFYKANIFQNSGVKWNNVRLSLSTGNPNEGVQTPTLNPWYLSFYTPQYDGNYNRGRGDYMGVANTRRRGEEVVTEKSTVPWGPKTRAGLDEQASINQYVSVDNSGVNTTFDIDLPYSIPSDGKEHLVAIKRYELPATYRYYVVPKLDKDAFLQAQITNWEDLNLLPGTSNIFYEGTFVGQGIIDTRNIRDTMILSLGRDKKIIVKRERDVKLRSVKTIGTNVRETFAYTISVRNTRKESISIVVQDQQPVSNDKDISVEDKETGESEYDEKSGSMKWNLSVGINETKKLNFGYTIKYPKGKTVTNTK